MGDVTSHPLANQAGSCLFGSSLNTSLCKIYDHKAQKFQSPYMEKTYRFIDLSYNIEECLAANDYFTD